MSYIFKTFKYTFTYYCIDYNNKLLRNKYKLF